MIAYKNKVPLLTCETSKVWPGATSGRTCTSITMTDGSARCANHLCSTVMRAFALLQLCVEAAVHEPGGEGSIVDRLK